MVAILPPTNAPVPTTLPPAEAAKAAHAAQEFEAMAIGELIQPMFQTADVAKTPFGGGEAEETWAPMFAQEIAKQIAHAGGLGLARPVLVEMLRLQEAKSAAGAVR